MEQGNTGKTWGPTSISDKKHLGPVQNCTCCTLTCSLILISPIIFIIILKYLLRDTLYLFLALC